jgi:putative membrane protein
MRAFLAGAAHLCTRAAAPFRHPGRCAAEDGPPAESGTVEPPPPAGGRLARLAMLSPALLAQPETDPSPGRLDLVSELAHPLLLAVVFTLIGLVLFAGSLWLIAKIAPFSVRKEVEEDQNVALGIIIGSIILGIAIILAASMLG